MAEMPPPIPSPESSRFRALLREEIFTLAAPNIMAVVLVLLAPTMVASMTSGLVALCLLWVSGITLSFAIKPVWKVRWFHRLIFALCSGGAYLVLGFYYAKTFEAPITKADLEAAMFQSPSLSITDLTPFWLTKSESDILRFNLTYINQGQAAVRNPIVHFGLGVTPGPLNPMCEDAMLHGFGQFAPPSAASADILERNDPRTSTLPPNLDDKKQGITQAKFKDIQQKKGALYLFVDLRFLDVRTGKMWQTERCQYWDFNVPPEYLARSLPHMCKAHNGTFPVEPEQPIPALCKFHPL